MSFILIVNWTLLQVSVAGAQQRVPLVFTGTDSDTDEDADTDTYTYTDTDADADKNAHT